MSLIASCVCNPPRSSFQSVEKRGVHDRSEMIDACFHQGMPFLLGPMLATGELFEAWNAGLAHPYIYGVIILEAFATYIGQLSVLSLIALFGAATTAMVSLAFQLQRSGKAREV
jgi:hypothetical protein